ncbi:MAG: hydrogenase formation protein HypD [Oscillospiraceae bacterium]|nr:hydrogenase formation protein HypD [Oscillospiraceae bacterium]
MPSDKRCGELLEAIHGLQLGETRIMEVCGTHTMSIAEAGIRSLLPKQVHLLSGPGCPVCVTPPEEIDGFLELAMEKDIVITTYGDMLRVPGSQRGDSLLRRRALGADVRIVYSPVDALDIASAIPGKQIVFLGVGFETTAPGTAAAAKIAGERGLKNFTVLSLLKSVEPALRTLIAMPDLAIQGFLCPGHVATIVGEEGFRFLETEYRMPGVIGGFEAEEILLALFLLLKQIRDGRPRIQNAYPRAVRSEGNPLAKRMLESCFEKKPAIWRGLGEIPASGFALKGELAELDAARRFQFSKKPAASENGCRCGSVITGKIAPQDCPLFGKVCTPEDPVGPCMVSSEGSCAAAYKYQDTEL